MERKPLYFDNAATSHPKPEAVYQSCDRALRQLGNPGRGGHRLALDGARTMFEGREAVGAFLGVASERLIFTSGCTASINLVLNGLVGGGRLKAGDSVLVSSYEHNAVMRPLRWLQDHLGIKVVQIGQASGHVGLIDIGHFQLLLKKTRPALCVLTMASNVTGEILNLDQAHALCQMHGLPLLIDGAQGAGAIKFSLVDYPAVSFFAASAHKAMLGPPGLGFLFVREAEILDPSLCGGTGSRSESLDMPQFLPDRLEPGTPAAHLVAGLSAAVNFINENGEELRRHERELAHYFIEKIKLMPKVLLHGRNLENGSASSSGLPAPAGGESRQSEGESKSKENNKSDQDSKTTMKNSSHLPTFALSLAGSSADVVADRLDREFDIAVRPGLHCAVSAHETLGSKESGLVRVSFGAFNTKEEIDQLCVALAAIN